MNISPVFSLLFILGFFLACLPDVQAVDLHDPNAGDWVYVSSECLFPGEPTEPDGKTRIIGDYKQVQNNFISLGNMGTGVQGTSSNPPSGSYHDYPYSYINCDSANLHVKCIDIICGNEPWLFIDATQQTATSYFNDDCGCNTDPVFISNQQFWWIGTRQKHYGTVSLYKWKPNCNVVYNELVNRCSGESNIIEWSEITCSGLCGNDKSSNFGPPTGFSLPLTPDQPTCRE